MEKRLKVYGGYDGYGVEHMVDMVDIGVDMMGMVCEGVYK